MSKWFLLIAIAYIGFRIWSHKARPRSSSPHSPRTELMLECMQCGLRFPESEAVREEGDIFCCEQHRQLWLRNR